MKLKTQDKQVNSPRVNVGNFRGLEFCACCSEKFERQLKEERQNTNDVVDFFYCGPCSTLTMLDVSSLE